MITWIFLHLISPPCAASHNERRNSLLSIGQSRPITSCSDEVLIEKKVRFREIRLIVISMTVITHLKLQLTASKLTALFH